MLQQRLFFVFLLAANAVLAQTIVVKGTIVNGKTPIAYANIGVINTAFGTLSNPDGTFYLELPDRLQQDSISFSALGFGKRAVPVSFFISTPDAVIHLAEQPVVLEAVELKQKREKNKLFVLGNTSVRGGVLENDTTYAGRSLALLIGDTRSDQPGGFIFPVYLRSASLKILRNNLPSCKFRLRVNAVDPATGVPADDILQKSVVVQSALRKGWIDFDLSSLNLVVDKPFFITFEQITNVNDRIAIANGYQEYMREHPEKLKTDTVIVAGKKEVVKTLRGGIDLPGTFVAISTTVKARERFVSFERENSFGEWKRVSGIITAKVTLSNQKADSSGAIVPPCAPDDVPCRSLALCTSFLEETGLAGLQIAVAKRGKIVWSAQSGFADVARKVPVNTRTQFRINSISKSITAFALVQLASTGKVDLDRPVSDYLPDFPVKKYSPTLRQLAGHLGGVRDYDEHNPDDLIRREHYNSCTEALSIIEKDSLLCKPGTNFHYSTFGWIVVGAVMERVTGEPYLTYMKKHVFDPLALAYTTGDDVTATRLDRSKFYDSAGVENDMGDISYKYAGGGLLSTAEDLARFGSAMIRDEIVNPVMRRNLFSEQSTTNGVLTGYGMGWYVGKDENGHRIWYHSGDMFSSSSHLIVYPDDDVVIAFVANGQQGAAFNVQTIGEMFYDLH